MMFINRLHIYDLVTSASFPSSSFDLLMDCFSLEEDEGLSFSIGTDEDTNNHELDTVFEEIQVNNGDGKMVSTYHL